MFSFGLQPEKKSPFYKHYNQLRELGRRLSDEIPQSYDLKQAIPKIVRTLGIGQGKNILMESDEELNFFIDFLINLSKTAKPGYVIFSRLLPFAEFNGFSGMFAAFDSGNDRALLRRYKIMKKRVKSDQDSVQRFVACFKMNRAIGMESRTA